MRNAEVDGWKDSQSNSRQAASTNSSTISEKKEGHPSQTSSRQGSPPKVSLKASVAQFPRTRSRGGSKSKPHENSVDKLSRVLKILKCLSESRNSREPVWITPHIAINSDFWAVNPSVVSADAIKLRTDALNNFCDSIACSEDAATTIKPISSSTAAQRTVAAFKTSFAHRRISSLSIGGIKETIRSYSDRQITRHSNSSNMSSLGHSSQPSASSSAHSEHPEYRNHKIDKPLPLPPLPNGSSPSVTNLEDPNELAISRLRVDNNTTGSGPSSGLNEKELANSHKITAPTLVGEITIKDYANSLARVWDASQLENSATSALLDLLREIGDQIVSDILYLLRTSMNHALNRIKRSSK